MGRGVARDGDVKEDGSKVMKNCLDLVLLLEAWRVYQRLRLIKEKVLDLCFRKITLIRRLSREDTRSRDESFI